MIQINISNKITFLNYWNSTISNKILATKPQLWFWNVIRNDFRTTEIYIQKQQIQDHIFFALFESDPDDSAMRNAVDALFPDPNKVNVSLGGGRGSKRGSCVKKIQAFSFLNKWNQIGVFFAGVFFLAGTEVVSFFLRQFGSCWGWIHGTCNDGKTSRKRVSGKRLPFLKGLKSVMAKSPR